MSDPLPQQKLFRSSGGGISFSMTTNQLKNRSHAARAEVDGTICGMRHQNPRLMPKPTWKEFQEVVALPLWSP